MVENYNIKHAVDNIKASWDELQESTMNCCWKFLWKECVNDFKCFPKFSNAVRQVVDIGHKVLGRGFL